MESPLLQLCVLGIAGYVFYLWLTDLKACKAGVAATNATLPGATPAKAKWISFGIFGAVFIVILETLGENLLGISDEQSSMTILFACVTIAAGFGEELIFRGFLVIDKKSKGILWLSIFAFSAIFALIHPFLWVWEENRLELQLKPKAAFSTGIVFLNSIWFYYLRFSSVNESRSLWPCIAAHTSSNGAVFLIKLSQGHVSGLY